MGRTLLQNIRKLFKRTRFWLKRMGDNAGVGIEPDASSALADRTESLVGVLCAGVPGAFRHFERNYLFT